MILETVLESRSCFDYLTVNPFFFELHIDGQRAFPLFPHSASFLVRGDQITYAPAIRRFFTLFHEIAPDIAFVFAAPVACSERLVFLDAKARLEAGTCFGYVSLFHSRFLSLFYFRSLTHSCAYMRLSPSVWVLASLVFQAPTRFWHFTGSVPSRRLGC